MARRILLFFLLAGVSLITHGQNIIGANSHVITGKVYDNTTGAPIAHVNVYLNGSSYFTATNDSGAFYLNVPKKINTQLVINHMSYETLMIDKPFEKNLSKIYLDEKDYGLSEVVIKPGRFSRQELLKAFELQFLGNNKSGRSCKILNEDDINLRYDENDKTLYATNEQPVIVENKYLGYQMSCSLTNCKVRYRDKSLKPRSMETTLLLCGIFFVDTAPPYNFVIKKRRDEMYKSSLNYFFKNLAAKTLKSSKYLVYNYGRNYTVNPDQYFDAIDSGLQKIVRIKPNTDISKYAGSMHQFPFPVSGSITVVDPQGGSSDIFFLTEELAVDAFGLIDKNDHVSVSGAMGTQRIGSMLPLDYGLSKND